MPFLTPSRLTSWPLATAVTLHLALLAAAFLYSPRVPPPEPRVERSVKIRIVNQRPPKPPKTRPPATPPARPEGKAASPGARTTSHPRPARPNPNRDAPADKAAAYQDLLPGADWQPAPEGAAAGSGEGPPSTETGMVLGELLGKLDIPLVFRQAGATLKAVAKVVRRPGAAAGWRFAYVDGDPMLRAVLFEALRDPGNRRTVLALFRQLKSDEVLVSLRQHTVWTDAPREPYLETVTTEGRKIVVDRTLFVGSNVGGGSGGGIPLPDKEAERAKLRDRVHLEKLETSPAYISPLRERDP